MSTIIVPASDAAVERAVGLLRSGELVAFPTETVYGLGADAGNPDAVRRIFAAKRRPAEHPVIVHVADATHVEYWARAFPRDARKLADVFWPGPLTLILPKASNVSAVVTGEQDTVGLRVPSHPIARKLLTGFARVGGCGIAAPSANRYGRISPTLAQHVADDLDAAVALILDGGPCEVGIESTIIAFSGDEPMLLRPGGISIAALANVLGRAPAPAIASAPRAPGTMASHYAPRTPATLVASEALLAEITQRVDRDEEVAVLALSVAQPDDFADLWISSPANPAAYARELYANLRALDAADADHILIESVPNDDSWLAVRDRLGRATRGESDELD